MSELNEHKPLSPMPREREDMAAWIQVVELFRRHGMPEPPVRLRDEIVHLMMWGWYGEKAADELERRTPAPSSHLEPDFRALAVEIVDGIRGYTFEFSSAPLAHKEDYDFIEEKLRAAWSPAPQPDVAADTVAMKRLYQKLAQEGGGNWAIDVISDVERLIATAPSQHVAVAAREFMSATEALLDWMNNTELAADHIRQQPEDFDRLCTTMLSLRAALATTEGKDNG